MPTPILTTALHIPQPPPQAVRRSRLIEELNAGLHRKLTLISAPAGFGKTTVVSEWVSGCGRPVAWLSLDTGHNDLDGFLSYLIAALQTISSTLGDGALGALQVPQSTDMESVLTILVNEIAAVPEAIVLVLDDCHLIESQAVDAALAFLLRNLPQQMHLVMATREDPNLPLALLRSRGQMTELRAADLRFVLDESTVFLNDANGLSLTVEDVGALEARTEGWIAGLQLAAISLKGHGNAAGFIQSFTGSHQYVMDYLVEEVLQQQPAAVEQFLLSTCILERFCGSLCDALTEGAPSAGAETLRKLRNSNLFLIPLDDKREWYRYHHLFAELLRNRLEASNGEGLKARLHLRASRWFDANGLELEALDHALAAGDFACAASVAERSWKEMERRIQTTAWLERVLGIPKEWITCRPVLCLGVAWALLNIGELEKGEVWLQETERWVDAAAAGGASPDGMVVEDPALFDALPMEIPDARAYITQISGDTTGTVAYVRQALDLIPEDDDLKRGSVIALLGCAHWANDNLEAAVQAFEDSGKGMNQAGYAHFASAITIGTGRIKQVQGLLRAAKRAYEQTISDLGKVGELGIPVEAYLLGDLSQVHCEMGDATAAEQCLRRSRELDAQNAFPEWPYRKALAEARLLEIRGDLDGALEELDNATYLYCRTPLPDFRPAAALKVRIWIATDRMAEARAWFQDQAVGIDDAPSYLMEFTQLTMARVRIAEYRREPSAQALDPVVRLLAGLASAAKAGRREGSLLEILVMTALTHEATGDLPGALEALAQALTLAEPEGYARIFADEGEPMARLLAKAAEENIRSDYTASLRAIMKADRATATEDGSQPTPQPLVEPLTHRELEILDLIAQGLSNNDIAERLFLALTTIKGHNQNIFGKLGVKRRTKAVARARELGLI